MTNKNINTRLGTHEEMMSLMLHDDLFERICDDNTPSKSDIHVPEGFFHIIISTVNDRLASYFLIHHHNHMHFGVLKPYRKFARTLFNKAFNFYGQDVFCEIPACYPEVINAAKRVGFTQTKILKK